MIDDTDDMTVAEERILYFTQYLPLRYGWLPIMAFLGWSMVGFEDWRFWALVGVGFLGAAGNFRVGFALGFVGGMEADEDV